IGEKTLEDIRNVAHHKAMSLWEAGKFLVAEKHFTTRAATSINQFIHLIEALRKETNPLDLDKQISQVIQKSGLYHHFTQEKGEKAESRLENLKELVNAAKQFRYEYDNEAS